MHRPVHDEPDNGSHDEQKPGRRVKAHELGFREVDQGPVEVGSRLLAVIHEDEPAIPEHGPERDDKRVDTGLPDDQAVQGTQQNAGHKSKCPCNRNDAVAEAGKHRPCHAVEQHDGTEGKGRADAEVDVAVDHDDGHADGDDADGRGLLEQQQHVVQIHEGLVAERQVFAGDREEEQLDNDKSPDRAAFQKGTESSRFHVSLPHAIGDQSLPRLAATSSQTASMMMIQVTTYWT